MNVRSYRLGKVTVTVTMTVTVTVTRVGSTEQSVWMGVKGQRMTTVLSNQTSRFQHVIE